MKNSDIKIENVSRIFTISSLSLKNTFFDDFLACNNRENMMNSMLTMINNKFNPAKARKDL